MYRWFCHSVKGRLNQLPDDPPLHILPHLLAQSLMLVVSVPRWRRCQSNARSSCLTLMSLNSELFAYWGNSGCNAHKKWNRCSEMRFISMEYSLHHDYRVCKFNSRVQIHQKEMILVWFLIDSLTLLSRHGCANVTLGTYPVKPGWKWIEMHMNMSSIDDWHSNVWFPSPFHCMKCRENRLNNS